jgi:hypothetical protein
MMLLCELGSAGPGIRAAAALAVLLGASSASAASAQPSAGELAPTLSQRAEVVRRACRTDQMQRELTLFGSGVVRLRDGVIGGEAAGTFELTAQELFDFLQRLRGEDLSEVQHLSQGPTGDWISRCVLTLQLPGKAQQNYFYGPYDRLPLNLSRVLRIVDEIEAKVPDLKISDRLPADFVARIGDVLRRQDGALFRVAGFTSDGKGVRLEGMAIPLALYLTPEELLHQFVALVERDKPMR